MNVTTGSLHRFHTLLVHGLRDRGGEALRRPFTVAEIYQDLVPYRRYRDELGVEMNGDYEHLLLRLLAGEDGLVKLESEPALREIQDELKSSNPNTGVYREYAAVDVRLLVADAGGDPVAADPAGPAASSEDPEPEEAPVAEPRSPRPAADRAPAAARGADAGESCPWCKGGLPARDTLRYCPHCGTDVRTRPCPECGETIEAGWRFCIACGSEADRA